MLDMQDWQAIELTIKLASVTTFILLLVGTPIAYWLSQTRSFWKPLVSAIVALPLILPPTVLGFYFLLVMGPQGWLGQLTNYLGLGTLAFTFPGLVVASVCYSLPFVVQPIQNTMEQLDPAIWEVSSMLGARPFDQFFTVILPLTKTGFVTACVLGFAHTVGEFGVILMIGGNIPEVTQVVSIQIYQHVETLNYDKAHQLSLCMVVFSLVVLIWVYGFHRSYMNKVLK